ncbi:unnamed protein product [Linum tenue]|uniref:TRF2/HOY1 PH-like domain-containing protein n=1 Tax=Linum tenue TaxID=586396 RepID=A0AAV0PRP4_9ROSI|nr:unnamed protein product [Linum tenue]
MSRLLAGDDDQVAATVASRAMSLRITATAFLIFAMAAKTHFLWTIVILYWRNGLEKKLCFSGNEYLLGIEFVLLSGTGNGELVWEVLDGGLKNKNKIEIKWSDILAIKGDFPDDAELESLHVVEGPSPSGVLPSTSNGSTADCQLFVGRHGGSISQKAPLPNPHGLLKPSMSIDDLVNYIGHCTSELKTGEIPFSFGQLKNGNILEEITWHLLRDSQFTSDEESHLMSRLELRKQHPPSLASEGEVKSGLLYKAAASATMPRNNSIGELLNLPRIASLPRFLSNM